MVLGKHEDILFGIRCKKCGEIALGDFTIKNKPYNQLKKGLEGKPIEFLKGTPGHESDLETIRATIMTTTPYLLRPYYLL